MQTFGQEIQITRPHAPQPAFDKHFAQLVEEYNAIRVINLLGTQENEAILAHVYARYLHAAQAAVFGNDVGIAHFDFRGAARVSGHESIAYELR